MAAESPFHVGFYQTVDVSLATEDKKEKVSVEKADMSKVVLTKTIFSKSHVVLLIWPNERIDFLST